MLNYENNNMEKLVHTKDNNKDNLDSNRCDFKFSLISY